MGAETYKQKKEMASRKANTHRRKIRPRSKSRGILLKASVFVGIAVMVLGAIFFLNTRGGSSSGSGGSGNYVFQVGSPGPGEQAPPIHLVSTDGSTFDLDALRGKTVLLYFQEGLGCQPCWDQMKDIDGQKSAFQNLGIDTMVSITTNPLDAIKQKVNDEGISMPVLSDPNFAVSRMYNADKYGMMSNADGHTFILVGPDGKIRWRADYGGAPNYTMYIPISTLLSDMKEGLNGRTGS